MDLGISGRKALVCGASAGLGHACAQALVQDGVSVVIVARTEGPLKDAAARLAALGAGRVEWVTADVTTDEGRARIFASHPDFDILVTNAGQMIRCPVNGIRIAGRRTQGVTLFKFEENDRVVSVSRIMAETEDETATPAPTNPTPAQDSLL
jgi:NAD(P)-dependent dehydrogenase (short-subunit alcohol dehydrogenase family)